MAWTNPTANPPSGSPASPIIPIGAVMYFNLLNCPSGWSLLSAADGRYIVGITSTTTKTLAGTNGTALSNLEDRPVGQHTHGVSDPGHSHSGSANTAGDHMHYLAVGEGSSAQSGATFWPMTTATGWIQYDGRFVEGSLNAYRTKYSGNHSHSLSINSAGTGISIQNSGSVAGTNAPYIQLLVCQKN